MTNILCPQFPMALPVGIEIESTRTLAHGYYAFGLSRDGALPKALHIGKADDATAQHFTLFPGGKQVDLSFGATLFSKDRAVLQCFESAIGFDRQMYEKKGDAVDQKTPLARFYQDQMLEVWDPILEAKTKDSQAGQAVIYKDLLKFWDDGIGDANTSTLNFAVLQGMLDHIEHKDTYLTIYDMVAVHDKNVALMLEKGAMVCHAEDWGKQFYMNDKKEFKIVCERPTSLADLAIAADKNLPTAGSKVTPSDFKGAAQQLKVLGLKPANLKEAGQELDVMPSTAQGVLNDTGYESHKALSKNQYYGLIAGIGAALAVGIGVGWLMRGRKSPKDGKTNGSPHKPKHPDAQAAMNRDQRPADTGIPTPAKKTAPQAANTQVIVAAAVTPQAGASDPTPKALAASTIVAPAGDMADLASALAQAASNKSPTGPSSVGSSSLDITADNVIIRDAGIPMPTELSRKVVMAEITALYPKFLTEGKGATIQPLFRAGVERLADMAIKYVQNRPADAPPIASLWDMEQTHRGSRLRGGIPETVLREFVAQQLDKWSQAHDSTMSFDTATRERMDSEAGQRAGERKAFEIWIVEALRDPAVLAGR